MSNLEELLEKLCPDGVEYKTLTELFDTRNGYTPSKSKEEYWTNGTVPWFRMEDIRENGSILSKAIQYVSESAIKGSLFPADSIIVATSATIGQHALIRVPSLANQRFTYLVLKEEFKEQLDIMFIYYCCFKLDEYCKECLNQGNFASVDMKKFLKFKFPVPPLEVQREIVRILDNFTFLTTELAAELAARQKQYEYYWDLLLTFKPNESTILNERTNELELSGAIRWMKLGDTCVLKAGKAISAAEISQNVNDDYIYPCYGGNGLRGYVKNYNQDGKHPLIGRQGALCGNVCYAYDKFYATEHAVVVSPSDLYNEKFLYYLLDFAKLEQYKTAGAQPGLSVARLEKIILPVPPLEQQQHIVDILDRFDTLCNDISSGLPAEIEMRQKQYEYYRDKLLTFKELKKEA